MKSEKMEMVAKQSFDSQDDDKTIDAGMEKKFKSAAEEMATEKAEPWHKRKEGSVFPAKRRSVKKRIWDRLFGNKKKKSNHVCSSSDMGEFD